MSTYCLRTASAADLSVFITSIENIWCTIMRMNVRNAGMNLVFVYLFISRNIDVCIIPCANCTDFGCPCEELVDLLCLCGRTL